MTELQRPLERSQALLLIVDVQERINLAMADQGHLPRIAALAAGCRTLEVPILATEQYPKGLGATVQELAAALPSPPIVKNTFSCLREPSIRQAIEAAGRRQVVVCGIEAHVCVAQTVIDLLHAGLAVFVPHDAVNSRRAADRQWALHRMAAAGAVVTSAESVLFELVERCGTDDFRAVAELIRQIPPVDG
jgi:nicotinamidase-related amidase